MLYTLVNCPQSKYSIKCPKVMNPEFIIVHNTANRASAMAEVSYMLRNNNYVSYHFAVDEERVVQGIPLNRMTYNCGNKWGNERSISIEIARSTSDVETFKLAEKNAAKLIAKLLKQYGWGIDKVKKHQDMNGKYCPHKTLDLGWERFLNMVREEMGGQPVQPTVQSYNPNVEYRVKTQKHGWLPFVKNTEDYAGWQNSPITDVAIKVDKGTVKYRVHVLGGGWLPYVRGCNINDHNNGYAGNGRKIDAIECYYFTPDDVRPFKRIRYSVDGLSWQYDNEKSNGQDGYAGIFGQTIESLKMEII